MILSLKNNVSGDPLFSPVDTAFVQKYFYLEMQLDVSGNIYSEKTGLVFCCLENIYILAFPTAGKVCAVTPANYRLLREYNSLTDEHMSKTGQTSAQSKELLLTVQSQRFAAHLALLLTT